MRTLLLSTLVLGGSPLLAQSPTPGDTGSQPKLGLQVLEDRVVISLGQENFTEFVWGETRRPYLYPLLGPGGAPLSRGYPMDPRPGEAHDHPHHQSLWFAHGSVNGNDFWHGSARDERIEHVAVELARIEPDGAATLRTRASWVVGMDEVLLHEEREMQFRASAQARTIDFDLRLRPAGAEVTLGDTKEGSFALRLAPSLRLRGEVAAGKAVNSQGQRGGAVWGERAAWVAYSGPVQAATFTVVIFDHPDNPRHPTWWHARDYGLFAANPFGVHDFEQRPAGTGDMTLTPQQELRLRYRVQLLLGERTVEQLDEAWRSWSAGR